MNSRRLSESSQLEEQKERNNEKVNSLNELWDTISQINICIMGVPEREERENWVESLVKEIIGENFSNIVREINIQYKKLKGQ